MTANSQALRKIDSLLSTVYNSNSPGISIGIVENGKTIYQKGYGIKDITTKQPILPSTNFNIASLTKQFTAMAVLQLAEEGRLALDDKLGKFLPALNEDVASKITIRELLTHSSGLIDHYDYADTKNIQHAHNIDVFKAIHNIDSTYFTPGTHFKYSNTGFCLLALIIEKASGVTFNTYMKQHIFQPAGMGHTTVWSENEMIYSAATGYELDSAAGSFKKSQAEEHIFFSTEGDGGIYTSVVDYIKWYTALQEGKIFSKTMAAQARNLEFTIDQSRQLGYGFGWFIDAGTKPAKVYHSGDNSGFRTFSFTIPQQDFLIVIFANRNDINIEDLVLKIYQLLMPGATPFIKAEELT
jgi:CubicO group peptidase (beta-lactamase class C family)